MLFLIRHGETFWNADGRLQGQCDTKLNGRGREQAREAGRLLALLLPDAAGRASSQARSSGPVNRWKF